MKKELLVSAACLAISFEICASTASTPSYQRRRSSLRSAYRPPSILEMPDKPALYEESIKSLEKRSDSSSSTTFDVDMSRVSGVPDKKTQQKNEDIQFWWSLIKGTDLRAHRATNPQDKLKLRNEAQRLRDVFHRKYGILTEEEYAL